MVRSVQRVKVRGIAVAPTDKAIPKNARLSEAGIFIIGPLICRYRILFFGFFLIDKVVDQLFIIF